MRTVAGSRGLKSTCLPFQRQIALVERVQPRKLRIVQHMYCSTFYIYIVLHRVQDTPSISTRTYYISFHPHSSHKTWLAPCSVQEAGVISQKACIASYDRTACQSSHRRTL